VHRSKRRVRLYVYSMTSSARTRSESGTARPSAFAVLRFMIISNLVGSSTGRSAATGIAASQAIHLVLWRPRYPVLVWLADGTEYPTTFWKAALRWCST
jgi:hypothetical protein